jgi:hypothetical protein
MSTLVDTAAEQARHARDQATDLAHETAKRASGATDKLVDLAEVAVPVVAARAAARGRKARRAARAKRRPTARRRPPIVPLLVIGAVITTVVVVRRRARRRFDISPAPDAFGAAVEAEREVSRARDFAGARPVATPGA